MTAENLLTGCHRESIRQAAYNLADSGRHAGWQSIEGILCSRYGVLAARRLFVDGSFCQTVNQRCSMAQRKRRTSGA
ncbi:hypothetical protein HDG34_003312 [Paraburkholderia sp. HC6.4b]|uniref:hypothetical protein n=1 Tax=unclassified Paraburkholderia TaxID=2615204 RepID=UPI00161532AC|nr:MULTISPECIES: hypothetical protein [unclassified Paraburkholderia]MBB5409371.1 hypothetical protein [Paraburkholderia sp. HC6.4b]MBB5451100.1 hypothetical protein [Paraburkholderia sp. Kb1A]